VDESMINWLKDQKESKEPLIVGVCDKIRAIQPEIDYSCDFHDDGHVEFY